MFGIEFSFTNIEKVTGQIFSRSDSDTINNHILFSARQCYLWIFSLFADFLMQEITSANVNILLFNIPV
jgi:hypothetical protein